MVDPEYCPVCDSDNIGIEPTLQLWVCFDCGYRIAPSGPTIIDPFFH